MNIIIRQEREEDYQQSEQVVEKAFETAEHADHKEHMLVTKLRKSEAFIPELSWVAELDGTIVGHIMLTRLTIENDKEKFESLALAPVSVLPEYQNQGIGSKLMVTSLNIALSMEYQSVVVLGHAEYYPEFGFKPASNWGIKAPFDVPDHNFMALELNDGSLQHVSGTVKYPMEFFA